MLIEQVAARDLRRMVAAGRVNRIIAVGLPGAWAINVISEECTEDGMTLQEAISRQAQPHTRYWSSLERLDRFLKDLGIEQYYVDHSNFSEHMPAVARMKVSFLRDRQSFWITSSRRI